jgi:UPF0755 protein
VIRSPLFRGLLVVGSAALLLAVCAGVVRVRRALGPAAPGAPEVLFEVARGESLASVAHHLERAGLVRDATALTWLARARGLSGALRAGEYRLSAALEPGEILRRIAAGEIATFEVVLPEGLTLRETAARLEHAGLASAAAFEAAACDPALARELGIEGETLEGYLFPETYRLPHGLDPRAIARVLVGQFHYHWKPLAERARALGLGMREAVTLASIVEKETGAPHERPLIASVFLNRLRRGMRLESDPTVIYGLPAFDGNLRRRDLDDSSNPYNTYQIRALPPGPIASPGELALRAVVDPAETKFLYFVSRNDGTHQFSASYGDHLAAVAEYQRKRARRSQAAQPR